ncbi:MAG: arginine utilization regulatory protein [Clostridium sp.]|jgi:arginine utilization regulatory protein
MIFDFNEKEVKVKIMDKSNKSVLDYVDSMMVVDKNLKVLHTNRFNPRFHNGLMNNEYIEYINKSYFEVYPELDPKESTMVECIKNGKILIRENQVFSDLSGKVYHTKNITYPIIRCGEIVGAIELSQDITSIGDLNPLVKEELSKTKIQKKKKTVSDTISFESIITNNEEMIENIRRAKIYALKDNPVLIYGETGTGKEMYVQAMVNNDIIRNNKFIAQNCASIPETLFESILFGSCKGAFTGAENKMGLFEMANGGVLFLDELNSIPMHLQAKLLRVLQDGKVRPVGSTVEKEVDVKVIVAINKNPIQLIKENLLREDLFYRLSSNTLHLVALRDRKEDIPLYIDYFIKQFNEVCNKNIYKLSTNLKNILVNYNWPGNVRELRHIIESMVNISQEEVLTTKNLPVYLKEVINTNCGSIENMLKKEDSIQLKTSLKELMNKTEREHIVRALIFCNGNISRAAELLELPRQTLKYRIDKLKIDTFR